VVEEDERPGLPSLRRSANMLVKLFMPTHRSRALLRACPDLWLGNVVTSES
jgi:hypothetical protein